MVDVIELGVSGLICQDMAATFWIWVVEQRLQGFRYGWFERILGLWRAFGGQSIFLHYICMV